MYIIYNKRFFYKFFPPHFHGQLFVLIPKFTTSPRSSGSHYVLLRHIQHVCCKKTNITKSHISIKFSHLRGIKKCQKNKRANKTANSSAICRLDGDSNGRVALHCLTKQPTESFFLYRHLTPRRLERSAAIWQLMFVMLKRHIRICLGNAAILLDTS